MRRRPVSRTDDVLDLAQSLRTARLERSLTQEQLANKLGLRQRQISDLERSANDPRLSTIQNVSRALDLELMLVPRQLIAAVEGLQRSSMAADASSKRPMYTRSDDDSEPQGKAGR